MDEPYVRVSLCGDLIVHRLQLLGPPGSTRGIAHVRDGKSRDPVSRGGRDRGFDPCGRG